MKKFILGIVIGAVLFVPMTVAADQFGLPFANKIYRYDSEDNTVSVFDDGNNKCYIVAGHWITGSQPTAISCVKK